VKKISYLAILILGLGLIMLTMPDLADAKRMGGGKSFGSKPSNSQSYQKSTPPPSSPTQQAAPGAAGAAGAAGKGMFGGMFGGMLGGMLLGGLLGSLFFGGGFGPGLMDIVLIGGGLYLLFRFLRSRKPAMQTPAGSPPVQDAPAGAWDHMRTTQAPTGSSQIPMPAGFDADDFLAGAKAAYIHLQSAWDKRDLNALRQFTSDEVFAELETQAKDDPTPGKTDILMVETQLLEVKTEGNQTIATVLFDCMLREDSATAPAEQVREVWHFSRYDIGGKPNWVVEGIQQLER
jgi:predicted lipid-binding transport protein (Tim44 family)